MSKGIFFAIVLAALLPAAPCWSAVSAQEAARLGADLTPLGGEKAGNADGTIPEWTGGIKSPADAGFPNYKSGAHHPDPFASDSALFTITPANMGQYAAKLTEGHKKLLQTYPDYKLIVYPTHRSAAFPQRIYDATRRVATTANLAAGGNGLPGMTEAGLNNIVAYFIQETTQPARLAGEILLVQETLDQSKDNRKAWIYNPGQRRVRRAPNVAFDNPGTNADNLRTSDQLDMYNGSPERYDWKLVGKKEMYVPYNAYKLGSDSIKYADILKKNHINQDLPRYELHRVWVVDSTLKPGTSHVYSRRTLYVDEDSWQILAVDCYDSRGQLYRVQEGHAMNYYELPNLWTTLELVMDLSNGRYLAMDLQNEEPKSYDFSIKRTAADYQPNALQMRGVR
jgi:hypothetical protein